mgnify:CR=1 FL=1
MGVRLLTLLVGEKNALFISFWKAVSARLPLDQRQGGVGRMVCGYCAPAAQHEGLSERVLEMCTVNRRRLRPSRVFTGTTPSHVGGSWVRAKADTV